MEELIKDKNYFTVQGWFVNELGLKGNELLVYSIIFGFSQDGESKFKGSRKYLAEWLGVSLPTVDKVLSNLIEKNLIIKEQDTINGVVFNSYYANLQGIKNFYRGYKEFLHNNNSNNKEIDNNKLLSTKKVNFIKPTIEEIQQYCYERNNRVDAEMFYDYYESNGWCVGKNKMKDWKACVRTWERNDKNKKSYVDERPPIDYAN